MDDERAADTTVLRIVVDLRDRAQLAEVIKRLRRTGPVLKVYRIKN